MFIGKNVTLSSIRSHESAVTRSTQQLPTTRRWPVVMLVVCRRDTLRERQRRLSGNIFSFIRALRAIKMHDGSIVTHSLVSLSLPRSRLKYFISIFRLFLREGIPYKWLDYFCKRIRNNKKYMFFQHIVGYWQILLSNLHRSCKRNRNKRNRTDSMFFINFYIYIYNNFNILIICVIFSNLIFYCYYNWIIIIIYHHFIFIMYKKSSYNRWYFWRTSTFVK